MMLVLSQTLSGLNPMLEFLIKLTIVFIVGWSIHGALRHCNPRWRILLWRGVGCGIVLIPLLVLLMPKLTVPVRFARRDAPKQDFVNSYPPMHIHSPMGVSAKPALADVTRVLAVQAGNLAEVPRTGSIIGKISLFRKYPWIAFGIVWSSMALGLFALAIRNFFAFRRMMSDSLPAPEPEQRLLHKVATDLGCKCPALRVSPGIPSPILFGIHQPVILLPGKLLTECHRMDLMGILAHELSHHRSNDLFWARFIQTLSILLWFHPLVWRMRRAHDLACELACDRIASDYVGNTGQYSRILADVALGAIGRQQLALGLSMARQPDILLRLEYLKRKVQGAPLRPGRKALALVSGVLLIASLTCIEIQLVYAQSPKPSPQTLNIAPDLSSPVPPSQHEGPALKAREGNVAKKGSAPDAQQDAKVVGHPPVESTSVAAPPSKADSPTHANAPATAPAPAMNVAGDRRWIEIEILPIVVSETRYKEYSALYNANDDGATSATLDFSGLFHLGSQILSELDLHQRPDVRKNIIQEFGPDNLNLHILEAEGILRLMQPARLKLRNEAGAQVAFLSKDIDEADVLRQLKDTTGGQTARVSPLEIKTDVAIRQSLEFQRPPVDFTGYNWSNQPELGAPVEKISMIQTQLVPHLAEATAQSSVVLDLRVLLAGPVSEASGTVVEQSSEAMKTGGGLNRPWQKKLITTKAKVSDGGAIMVGGFSGTWSQGFTATTPFFGKLPILGKRFFTRHNQQNDRVSLLLIVKCKRD